MRLEAHARGSPSMTAEARQSRVAHESAIAVLKSDDQTMAYRYSDSDGNTVAADLRGDSVDLDITGRSKTGEEGTPATCQTLIERLRRDGEEWSDPEDLSLSGAHREAGIDCRATGPAGELLIQVTRAEQRLWGSLASQGQVSSKGKPKEEAAEQLRATIERKANLIAQRDRVKLVLALNARDTPSLALAPVVSAFRARHGAWARNLGFNAIWMVGPSVSLTYQLDLISDPGVGDESSESKPLIKSDG